MTKTRSTVFQDQKAVKMETSCLEVFPRYGLTVHCGATVTLWLDSAMRSPEGRRGSTVPGGHQGGGEAVPRGQQGAGEARQCQEDAKVDEEQRHDSPLEARVTIWF